MTPFVHLEYFKSQPGHLKKAKEHESDFVTDLGINPGTFHGVGAKAANKLTLNQSQRYRKWMWIDGLMNCRDRINIDRSQGLRTVCLGILMQFIGMRHMFQK